MSSTITKSPLDDFIRIYPEKFVSEEQLFSQIHRGDRIFIGTACGEPQYLRHECLQTSAFF